MSSEPRVFVVVPAFNEARFIAETVSTMPSFVTRVVIVDDASRDDTRALAERAGAHVLAHAQNKGVGAAIATGYAHSLAEGADVVAVMAGDGQMAPGELAQVIAPIVSGDAEAELKVTLTWGSDGKA